MSKTTQNAYIGRGATQTRAGVIKLSDIVTPTIFASPPAIGSTVPAAGTFTNLTVTGSLILHVTTVVTAQSPYLVTDSDYFITTNSDGGEMTILLPSSPETGRCIYIYDGAGKAVNPKFVNINGNGHQILSFNSSDASVQFSAKYENIRVIFDGTSWCGVFSP